MKASTRLPGTLLITVGVMAGIYLGVLVYAHITHAPALPVPINTAILIGLATAGGCLCIWLIHLRSEERIAQRIAEHLTPARSVGVAPVHQIGVSRPRVVEPVWNSSDATIVLARTDDRKSPQRRRRRADRTASQTKGIDGDVIEIAKRLNGKIERAAHHHSS